jgi:hypothetical protein
VPGVVVPLEGDFNGDGIVDTADYVWWRKSDGTVAGYNTWRTNFGRTTAAGSGFAATSIPEPATVVLMLIASTILLGRTTRSAGWRRRLMCLVVKEVSTVA